MFESNLVTFLKDRSSCDAGFSYNDRLTGSTGARPICSIPVVMRLLLFFCADGQVQPNV